MTLTKRAKRYDFKKAIFLVGLCSLLSAPAFAQEEPCKIRFQYDSVEYNPEDLRSCENLLSTGAVTEIFIRGYASTPGTESYNLDLSKRRAENLEMDLKVRYPNVTIRSVGVGENATIGKTARVFAIDELGNPTSNVASQLLEPVVNPLGPNFGRQTKHTDWSWLGAFGLFGFFPLLKRNMRHNHSHKDDLHR